MSSKYTGNWPNVKYYRSYVIYLTLFIFLLPFIWWPKAVIAYELPRVWYVLIGVDIAVLAMLSVFHVHISKIFSIPHFKIMGLLLFTIVLSAVTGSDISKSFLGNPWRLDGVITFIHLAAFAVMIASLTEDAKTILIKSAGWSAFAMSALVSGEWIAYLVGYPVPTAAGALGSTFGQPNFLAGYLVVSLPFVWYVLRHRVGNIRVHTLPAVLLMSIPASAIFATGAKGGAAGLFLFGIFLISDVPRFKHPWFKRLMVGLGTVGILALIWYSFWTAAKIPQQVLAESRQRIMMKGLIAFTRRPVLGWGWANYDHAFASVDWPYHFRFDAYVDKAHSNGLEMLVTTGIMGFSVYGVFLYLIYRALSRQDKDPRRSLFMKTLLWTFWLYLFHSQTNVTSIAEEMVFWFIVGAATRASKNK